MCRVVLIHIDARAHRPDERSGADLPADRGTTSSIPKCATLALERCKRSSLCVSTAGLLARRRTETSIRTAARTPAPAARPLTGGTHFQLKPRDARLASAFANHPRIER